MIVDATRCETATRLAASGYNLRRARGELERLERSVRMLERARVSAIAADWGVTT